MTEPYRQFLVLVHMPHDSTIIPCSSQQKAEEIFEQLLQECIKRYGHVDVHGASENHCRMFGRYEIYNGYYLQLYEANLDEVRVKWL